MNSFFCIYIYINFTDTDSVYYIQISYGVSTYIKLSTSLIIIEKTWQQLEYNSGLGFK